MLYVLIDHSFGDGALCSPDWHRTHCVVHAGLELTEICLLSVRIKDVRHCTKLVFYVLKQAFAV